MRELASEATAASPGNALTRDSRVFWLDAVRCLAIVLVLAAHIANRVGSVVDTRFGIHGFWFDNVGGLGVTLFLIVSGAALQLRFRENKASYWTFVSRRLTRIYPVYWMCVPVGAAMFFARSYYESGGLGRALSELGLSDIVWSATGLYAFAGKWGGPFLPTSWFIALIVALYLIYPFMAQHMSGLTSSSRFCCL